MQLLSVVIPCRNEELGVKKLLSELERVFFEIRQCIEGFNFEVIFVDDGSSDKTLGIIKQESISGNWSFEIIWISFSRNFGKESALYAGLYESKGKFVATMDADLQDPPELLPQMLEILMTDENVDSVAAYRQSRSGEPYVRSYLSRAFYKVMNLVSDIKIINGARDYRLMRRKMVDAVLSMSERTRFTKGIYEWVGFNTAWIPYDNVERHAGKTGWGLGSLFAYSFNAITSFSTKPLMFSSILGFIMCAVSFCTIVFIVIRALAVSDPVPGWPSLVCVILFVGGLQLLGMGVFGQYLARVYAETKERPLYIVRESSAIDANENKGF